MIDKEMLKQVAAQNPQVAQAVDVIEARLSNMPGITPEIIDQMVSTLEYVLDNPQEYPKVREHAIRSGFASEQDLPAEFNPVLVVSLLLAFYGLQERAAAGRYARGGLARAAHRLQSAGRGGDTILAHINPREAAMLERAGGGGTVNPTTGLVEYKGGVGKLVAAVAPVALSILAPGIGTAIGTALGAGTGMAASALGGAVIGGAGSALSGGNVLQGALGGALGTGGAQVLGGGLSEALGANLGSTAQNVVGSALLGGAAGATSGQGFSSGLARGALGGFTGSTLSNAASGVGGGLGAGLQTAGQQFGNALSMGATPQEALAQSALTGLARGMSYNNKPAYDIAPKSGLGLQTPSDLAVQGLQGGEFLTPTTEGSPLYESSLGTGIAKPQTGLTLDQGWTPGTATQMAGPGPGAGEGLQGSPLSTIAAQTAATTPGTSGTVGNAPTTKGFGLGEMGNMANLLPALALFGSAQTPQQIQQATASMSPAQREYFNRALYTFDWDKIQSAARAANMGLGEFVAKSWNNIAQDTGYAKPYATIQQEVQKARGGAVRGYAMGGYASGGALSRLAHGGGSGRDDTISARLSDGEYVMDAETVALLGDGSTREGANRLDHMRAQLRRQKGKALAQGKFSPDAKSPLQYIKKGKV